MMLSRQCDEALREAAEADGDARVLQHRSNLVLRAELLGIEPDMFAHEEREVLRLFVRDDIIALQQHVMAHRDVLVVELVEACDALLFVVWLFLLRHEGKHWEVDRHESEIAAAAGDFRTVDVRHHSRSTHFMFYLVPSPYKSLVFTRCRTISLR